MKKQKKEKKRNEEKNNTIEKHKKTTTMQRIENGKTMMEQANPQQNMNEAKEKSLFVKFPPLLKKLPI